jgi:putative DNA primase/helicase
MEEVANHYENARQKIKSQISDAYRFGNKDQAKQLEGVENQLRRRIQSLRGVSGRSAGQEFAHSSPGGHNLSVTADQIDQCPYLLATKDSVCDLRTGHKRPGRREDNLLTSTDVMLPKDILNAKPKVWEKYLWESLEDQSVIDFLQRFIGYCLTGYTSEQVFLILSGLGRNGKTVFAEIVRRFMGKYAIPIQAEMLLDQGRGRAASAPSPDIMSLHGKRLVFASEPDENRRFSVGKIKWFTGSDTLTARNPHDRYETRFEPTHKLVMLTNNDPHASADDYAFWNRVCKVDWPFSFVDNPTRSSEKKKDPHLMDKLTNELPEILAWAIRGCLYWQRDGLQIPAKVKVATENYRRSEDIIQDFLDECCIVQEDPEKAHLYTVSSQAIYKRFSDWYIEYHGKRVPSMHWFGRRMVKRFIKQKSNTYRYLGLTITSE